MEDGSALFDLWMTLCLLDLQFTAGIYGGIYGYELRIDRYNNIIVLEINVIPSRVLLSFAAQGVQKFFRQIVVYDFNSSLFEDSEIKSHL